MALVRLPRMFARKPSNVRVAWLDPQSQRTLILHFRNWPIFKAGLKMQPPLGSRSQESCQTQRNKQKWWKPKKMKRNYRMRWCKQLPSRQKGRIIDKHYIKQTKKPWGFVDHIKIFPGTFWLAFILFCSQQSKFMTSVRRNKTFLFNCGLPFSKGWHVLRTLLH